LLRFTSLITDLSHRVQDGTKMRNQTMPRELYYEAFGKKGINLVGRSTAA